MVTIEGAISAFHFERKKVRCSLSGNKKSRNIFVIGNYWGLKCINRLEYKSYISIALAMYCLRLGW